MRAGEPARSRPKRDGATASPSAAAPPVQVDERVEKDPDEIDEMPIKPGDLDRRVIGRRERSAPGPHRDQRDNRDADQKMQGVDAGNAEIQEIEQLYGVSVRTGGRK